MAFPGRFKLCNNLQVSRTHLTTSVADASPVILDGPHYRTDKVRTLQGGTLRIHEAYIGNRLVGYWQIRNEQMEYSARICSADEFCAMARDAGFCCAWVYNSFAGDAFGRSSRELILVAQKGF